MLKRLVLMAFLLFASTNSGAEGYGDVYFNPAEPGWGIFLVQSDVTQFAAFFIYGPDGSPPGIRRAHRGRQRQLQRPALRHHRHLLRQSVAGLQHRCRRHRVVRADRRLRHAAVCVDRRPKRRETDPAANAHTVSAGRQLLGFDVRDRVRLCRSRRQRRALSRQVQPHGHADGRHGIGTDLHVCRQRHTGIVCTGTGPMANYGTRYKLNGQFSCTGQGLNPAPTPATIDSYHTTGQGIEGRLTTTTVDSCKLSLRFAAVLNN